jgi:hypothetical protein
LAIEYGVDYGDEGALYAAIARQMQVDRRVGACWTKKKRERPPALLPGLEPGVHFRLPAALHPGAVQAAAG